MKRYNDFEYPLQDLSYSIIGLGMEIHRHLGKGFLEIVYKDAFEFELKSKGIPYEREREFKINYKSITLPHKFYADFVIENRLILEIKSKSGIIDEHYAQVLNYLAVSKVPLGLILNFNYTSLQIKRVVLSK